MLIDIYCRQMLIALQARQKCLKDRICVWARYAWFTSSWYYIKERVSRGRGLGGSTAINFMAYSKPPAEEVDGNFY